ncbi:MAG: histidine kinase [Lachnospiraceae bacterium]|nr:histidine kinase [Lachnospiraceae bacterium]
MQDTERNEQKSRPRRSWIRTTLWFLLLIFAVSLALQIIMNVNYIRSVQKQTVTENANAVHIFARTVDVELESVNESLHELLILVYSKTELRSGSGMMTAKVKQEINTTMSNKMISNPRIDFFCLEDTESELYLFNANSLISDIRKTGLKQMKARYTQENARSLWDHNWDLITDSGETFLIKSIMLGKYILTAATSLQHYPISEIAVVSGEDPVLLFETEEGAVCFTASSDTDAAELLDEEGRYRASRKYLASEDKMSLIDGRVLLLVERESVRSLNSYSNSLLFMTVSILSLILLLFFFVLLNHDVIRPTRTMMAAISEIQKGNFGYRIEQKMTNREFQELTDNFNEMSQQIEIAQKEQYDRLKKEEEDKLHLLRAQIKPHFYLNAITTISNMTFQGRLEDIRKYCSVLARYMRYMLEVKSDFTTVGEELTHIQNYITMQQIRFPGSVSAEIRCEDAAKNVRIPLLVMFTIVENSFKHAMDLYKEMQLRIECRKDADDCRIRITDNGPGFAEEVLENRNDTDAIFNTRNHIGLSNASYTLRLTYKRPDLLMLSNLPEGGACVDILIPDEREVNHETSDL